MSNEPKTHDEAVKKIADLIEGINLAMMTSVAEDGHLHARPMATQDVKFDGTLWFFTYRDSPKVDQFQRNPHVNVAYSDPGKNRYVSLAGNASLVMDRALFERYWNDGLKAWFPKGLDDPELALIRVDPESAEYWDSPSNKMVKLAGLVKAKVTGQRAKGGENAEVEL